MFDLHNFLHQDIMNSFSESLADEFGSHFFAGKIHENRNEPGIFVLQLRGPNPTISVYLTNVNEYGISQTSLWSLSVTDEQMQRHMEDDVGVYDQLTTFSSYFCDAFVANVTIDRSVLAVPVLERISQISLTLRYTISATLKLQGVLKLTLVQNNIDVTVFETLKNMFEFDYEKQRSEIITRKTERKKVPLLQVRPKQGAAYDGADDNGGEGGAAAVDDIPVVQKAKIRKTGGVNIFPGRKK